PPGAAHRALVRKEGVEPRRILRVQFDELPPLRDLSPPLLALLAWYENRILGETFNEAARARRPACVFLDEVQNLADRAPRLGDLAGHLAESVVGAYLAGIPPLDLAHFPERPTEPEIDFALTIGLKRIPLEVKYRRRVDCGVSPEPVPCSSPRFSSWRAAPPRRDRPVLPPIRWRLSRCRTMRRARSHSRPGCRVTQTLFLQNQEPPVRALAGAGGAGVPMTGFRHKVKHKLSDRDLEPIRRMAILWDRPELPAAPAKEHAPRGQPPDGPYFANDPAAGITNPQIIPTTKVVPRFPRTAQGSNVLGRVVLRAVIRKDGSVDDVEVAQPAGGDCGFEEAAIDAVRGARAPRGPLDTGRGRK
ncbi:MAG: energy transducer TonB, partial [Candidatus Polarisedimenticolia bacterium]